MAPWGDSWRQYGATPESGAEVAPLVEPVASIEAGESCYRLHTERRTGMCNIVRSQSVTRVMQWDALHPIGMHGPGTAENRHFYGMFWDT